MKIVYDDVKRRRNIEKHGFDFAELPETFFDTALVRKAKLGRAMALGRFAGGTKAVIFVPLGREAVSVISVRPASRKERSLL